MPFVQLFYTGIQLKIYEYGIQFTKQLFCQFFKILCIVFRVTYLKDPIHALKQ